MGNLVTRENKSIKMKKITLLFVALCAVVAVQAQIQTPQPSPSAKIEQKVGLTDVTVSYSRPSMRGREVFGNLVPYDAVWRTGANQNTIITFSDPIKIGGTMVEKGSYAIYTKPGKKSWEVYLYSDTNNWGNPQEWDDAKVVASYTAEVMEVPFDVETFTIDFNMLTNNGATLEILWENTYVAVPFEVPTSEKTMASIEKALNGPTGMDYYASAAYLLQEGKDIAQAKTWIDKAVSMLGDKTPFWVYRQQSLIYAKAGDKKGAIAAAKKSLDGATKAGNSDYVKMNNDSIKEWSK